MYAALMWYNSSIKEELAVADWKDLVAKGKIADAVVIGVMVSDAAGRFVDGLPLNPPAGLPPCASGDRVRQTWL